MDTKAETLKGLEHAGKPMRPGDIAKMIYLESKEVSKYIKELKKEGRIYSPKRCYYDIKK